MVYGYARVSTRGQAKDGNSLESQSLTLTEAGAEIIFSDAFTGTKKHRPELDKLLQTIQSGDTLVVTKLDRIARSMTQGTELVSSLLDKGVIVNVLNLGLMDNSPTGKLIRGIFFAFAEFERDMIVERTSEGKEIARERGSFVEGRRRKDITDFQLLLQKQREGTISVVEACQELGISKRTWYNRVNEVAM